MVNWGLSSKRLFKWLAGLTLLLLVAIWAGFNLLLPAPTGPSPRPIDSLPPAAATPDPLTVAGLRIHPYRASEIVPERRLGDRNGHEDTIISYRSDDLKIYALMSKPAGNPPPGGWPVIILCHGYVDPKKYQTNGPEYTELIGAFTRAGYVVIKPDYRGHDQSEGQPVGGHFAPDYTYDILNLIATLKRTDQINDQRIGLAGHSLGGHVALRAIVVSRDVKATAMISGVVGSMEDIFFNWPRSPDRDDQPAGLVQGTRERLVRERGDPKSNPGYWNSASAINYVQAVAGPVQLNQSSADSTVPKLFSDRLNEALQQAGKRVEYRVYPGDDHQFVANRAALINNLVKFYRENL